MLAVVVTDWLPLLLAGIGGLGVCILGLRGRREGDEPHCRKCAYNLTGLTSQRCPECGSPILPDGTVYGTLRRRWLWVAGGALPLAACVWLGGTVAYQHVRMIDVRRYYPFEWLLSDARKGKGLGLIELIRRERYDELSPSQLGQLVETALEAQSQRPLPANLSTWLGTLNRWDVDEVLSADQRTRFYNALCRLVSPTFQERLKVRQGDNLRFSLAHDNLRVFTAFRRDYAFVANGQVLPAPQPAWYHRTPGMIWPGTGHFYTIPDLNLPAGRYELEYHARYDFFRSGQRPGHPDFSGSFLSKEVVVTTELEVSPPFDPARIRLVADPAMGASIAQAIKLQAIRAYHVRGVRHRQTVGSLLREMIKLRSPQTSDTGEANAKTSIRVPFRLEQPLPIAVAFDVLLRLPGGDVHVGMVAWPRKAKFLTRCAVGEMPAIDAREVLVVLRTNPEAARPYLEITQVWDGEIVLGPEYVWYEEHRSFIPSLMSPRVIPPPVNRP